jgi:Gas vesicle synthesis protein GvpL/GvpF
MSYLLYCLFRSLPQPEPEVLTGVDRQPVLVMDHRGLGAAISELREPDSHPDVARVLAYESVVESLFHRRTIIPMRYGCAVRDRPDLAAVLDKRREECEALLRRLEGLAEMGIHVQAGGSEADFEIGSAAVPPICLPGSKRSGASYLLAKQRYYRGADRNVERQNELVKTVCRPLAGLFVDRKVELPSRGAPLLSLYFLVPRASVEAFREGIGHAFPNEPARLQLSGPWPPYNFADFLTGSGIS